MENCTQNKQRWRRNAALFIASQGITLFGSSVVQMAIIWQVALETSSGLWVTLLTLSATVPQTALSLLGGVWADRYPRKWLIILADLGIASSPCCWRWFSCWAPQRGCCPCSCWPPRCAPWGRASRPRR